MKKMLILVSIFYSISSLYAQNFSGNIEFTYATQKDTTHNVYMVKNKQVRLDQYGKKGNLEGSFFLILAIMKLNF